MDDNMRWKWVPDNEVREINIENIRNLFSEYIRHLDRLGTGVTSEDIYQVEGQVLLAGMFNAPQSSIGKLCKEYKQLRQSITVKRPEDAKAKPTTEEPSGWVGPAKGWGRVAFKDSADTNIVIKPPQLHQDLMNREDGVTKMDKQESGSGQMSNISEIPTTLEDLAKLLQSKPLWQQHWFSVDWDAREGNLKIGELGQFRMQIRFYRWKHGDIGVGCIDELYNKALAIKTIEYNKKYKRGVREGAFAYTKKHYGDTIEDCIRSLYEDYLALYEKYLSDVRESCL